MIATLPRLAIVSASSGPSSRSAFPLTRRGCTSSCRPLRGHHRDRSVLGGPLSRQRRRVCRGVKRSSRSGRRAVPGPPAPQTAAPRLRFCRRRANPLTREWIGERVRTSDDSQTRLCVYRRRGLTRRRVAAEPTFELVVSGRVTFIQRINTQGGTQPPAAESKAQTENKVKEVPYHPSRACRTTSWTSTSAGTWSRWSTRDDPALLPQQLVDRLTISASHHDRVGRSTQRRGSRTRRPGWSRQIVRTSHQGTPGPSAGCCPGRGVGVEAGCRLHTALCLMKWWARGLEPMA